MLIASQDAVERFNLTLRARDPPHVGTRRRPGDDADRRFPAIQQGLKRTGMSIDGIDTIEIYEAFAPVVLAAHRMREAAAGFPLGPHTFWLYRARSRFLMATHVHT